VQDEPKYPNISVQLIGNSGNAFEIIAHVRKAMRDEGVSEEELYDFFVEATEGSYENLLLVCMKWVDVV
jgi:hypothetical protein